MLPDDRAAQERIPLELSEIFSKKKQFNSTKTITKGNLVMCKQITHVKTDSVESAKVSG